MTKIRVLAAFGVVLGAVTVAPASAASTLCVGARTGCYATLQAAVGAAHDGDTIRLDPGTFAGGVQVNVSVAVIGAGAGVTTIQGGGPVLTIGAFLASVEPTVTIQGVTITGGLTTATNGDTFAALGGGIYLPPSANFGRGATLKVYDSAITANTTLPSTPFPGGTTGLSEGSGIDSAGDVTLVDTQVTNNVGGSASAVPTLAGEVRAAGIYNHVQGALTILRSSISGNREAIAGSGITDAEAGAIDSFGPLNISDSLIADNSVVAAASGPWDGAAFAGGIHISICCDAPSVATITRTIIRGNSVTATNANGDAGAFAGGILDEGGLTLTHSSVDHNHVAVRAGNGGAFADGGGLEVDGTAEIDDSVILANDVTARNPGGFVLAQGGGLANAGQTTLQRTVVAGNTLSAIGSTGVVQGAGIWNDVFDPSMPPPTLSLIGSAVVGNRALSSRGITPQGGGIFTTHAITLTRSLVAGNAPDQCFGC